MRRQCLSPMTDELRDDIFIVLSFDGIVAVATSKGRTRGTIRYLILLMFVLGIERIFCSLPCHGSQTRRMEINYWRKDESYFRFVFGSFNSFAA